MALAIKATNICLKGGLIKFTVLFMGFSFEILVVVQHALIKPNGNQVLNKLILERIANK